MKVLVEATFDELIVDIKWHTRSAEVLVQADVKMCHVFFAHSAHNNDWFSGFEDVAKAMAKQNGGDL